MAAINESFSENVTEYVTVMIADQLFGLPISRVQDVFMPDRLTRVPLSSPEIAGVLNPCGAGSDCRRAQTAGRRWRSASSSGPSPTGC